MVKKIVAIPLLVMFLFSNTELHEVCKLPILISHFMEHQKKDSNVSFISFLALHYSNESHESQQDQEHQKLPFKDESGCAHTIIAVHSENTVVIQKMDLRKTAPINTFIPENYTFQTSSGIWQPPKANTLYI